MSQYLVKVIQLTILWITKKITKSLIAFIESSDYKLIEALGEGIVDHLKSKFGIKKVKLRLSKPGALRFSKDVGIMIER